jgi:hypothetical protein
MIPYGIGISLSFDNWPPEEEAIHVNSTPFPQRRGIPWFVNHPIDTPCRGFRVHISLSTIHPHIDCLILPTLPATTHFSALHAFRSTRSNGSLRLGMTRVRYVSGKGTRQIFCPFLQELLPVTLPGNHRLWSRAVLADILLLPR